jgi:Cu(I)/Ag(I) efflux system membrane protein CusA/SilA
MRRGIAELDGQGEVAGGVIVMRSARTRWHHHRGGQGQARTAQGQPAAGVEVVPTYDRSQLIDRAIDNLRAQAAGGVHRGDGGLRHVPVPPALGAGGGHHLAGRHLAAFIVMRWQGVNANILSPGRHRASPAVRVDAAVVLIENAHKHWRRSSRRTRRRSRRSQERWTLVTEAAVEVGPALFFSLLVITLSFLPVFTLEAQEGRLFSPLAFTKTYAMAAAAACLSRWCRC